MLQLNLPAARHQNCEFRVTDVHFVPVVLQQTSQTTITTEYLASSKKRLATVITLTECSGKRQRNGLASVSPSVCLSHLFYNRNKARGAYSTWLTRGSTRRGQRTFPSQYYEDEHTCCSCPAQRHWSFNPHTLRGGITHRFRFLLATWSSLHRVRENAFEEASSVRTYAKEKWQMTNQHFSKKS